MDKKKKSYQKYSPSRNRKIKGQERNRVYDLSLTLSGGWRGGSGEGLWDISNDTPDPFEGRLGDYEVSDHS